MTVFSCIYLLFLFFWVLLVKVIIFFFVKEINIDFFFVKYERGSERDVSTVRSDLFPSYVFCPTIAFNSP